jgi:hypothetical protein
LFFHVKSREKKLTNLIFLLIFAIKTPFFQKIDFFSLIISYVILIKKKKKIQVGHYLWQACQDCGLWRDRGAVQGPCGLTGGSGRVAVAPFERGDRCGSNGATCVVWLWLPAWQWLWQDCTFFLVPFEKRKEKKRKKKWQSVYFFFFQL